MGQESFHSALHSAFGMLPVKGQELLFEHLEAFTRRREGHQLLVVKGYAGTGKTSVLAAYVKALREYKVKTFLMAPTGRAAKVFSQKAAQDAFTIHKLIYRRKSKIDVSAGLSLQPNLYKNAVFIVDESSMIADVSVSKDGQISPRNILEDVLEYVFSGQNCRLILMGDAGQLPPVGSDHSPALNVEYLRNYFPKVSIEEFVLDEVLRQSLDSEILRNATVLRNTIWKDYPRFDIRPGGDLRRISGLELQDELETAYGQVGQDETIVITRSNKQANGYNQQIRGRILWYEEQLCPGDLLMVVRNNYFWMGDDTRMGFIANGEQLRLVRIMRTEQLYGFEFVHALVRFVDYEEIGEVEVIMHTEALLSEAPAMSRERLKDLFFAIEEDYMDEKNKKKRYEAILADRYFNALQVKYSYAVTCHKSQGGQWKRVFIDQGFINEEMLDAGYYRWLYTALTRATEEAFLVNFADEFFIGQTT